ncbi:MAG: flagellar brake domain-containing protein [Defluviitaleaceae bacterium]|nr:flagellar brake domain-containing protein [Defluviitaleaceae bacterium]
MAFDFINIGDKLDIKVMYKNNSEQVYSSQIIDVLDKSNYVLAVTQASRNDEILEMYQDREYDVTIYTSESIIAFKGFFEGFIKGDGQIYKALRLSKDSYKMQRREFFRFSCDIPLKFMVMDFEEGDVAAELFFKAGMSTEYEGNAKDIGGGGLRFVTEHDLNMDYQIQIELTLGLTKLVLVGLILEKQYVPKTAQKYQYRVLFINIEPEYQESIISYIFSQQRKQRRNEAP